MSKSGWKKEGGRSSDGIGIGISMGRETGHLFVYLSCHATPRQRAERRGGVEMS